MWFGTEKACLDSPNLLANCLGIALVSSLPCLRPLMLPGFVAQERRIITVQTNGPKPPSRGRAEQSRGEKSEKVNDAEMRMNSVPQTLAPKLPSALNFTSLCL